MALTKVLLHPLLPEHTLNLVQDVFRAPTDLASPLATLIQDKTNGNPFFVCQFLRTIVQERLVVFDYPERRWKWHMEQLNSAQYMDNVVDFMIVKVKKLPEATQKLVQLAACLGNTFTAAELTNVAELPLVDTFKHLSTAIAGGFLQMVSQSPSLDSWKGSSDQGLEEMLDNPMQDRLKSPPNEEEVPVGEDNLGPGKPLQQFREHALPENLSELVIPVPIRESPPTTPNHHSPTLLEIAEGKYKFVHDRVQEAFYVMSDEKERKGIHLRIAHILYKQGVTESQDLLFTVVHHYNIAIDLILALPADHPDREALVSLNFEAAQKAKHTNAIESARSYLLHARRALTDDSFERNYKQSFELLLLLAEANYVCGDHKDAYGLFDLLLAKGSDKKDKARVHILAASCYESVSDYIGCITNCSSAAKLFGVDLPLRGTEKLMKDILDEIFKEQKARTKTIAELATLPFMDEEHQLIMEALYTAIAAAFVDQAQGNHYLFYYIAGRMCVLTIQHGICAFSANAFACFSGALAQYRLPYVYEFGQVAMGMHARIKVIILQHYKKDNLLTLLLSSTLPVWCEQRLISGHFLSGVQSQCKSAVRPSLVLSDTV